MRVHPRFRAQVFSRALSGLNREMCALSVPFVLLAVAAAFTGPTFASAAQAAQTQSPARQGDAEAQPTSEQANSQTGTAAHPRARSQKNPAPVQPAAQAPAQSVAPPAPIAPPPPNWPANDPPAPASVFWDSRGLSVTASNSSLAQILKEVSVDTGVQIEGFAGDERMFGTYGPGPAGDVLSELLDGTNYDVLIVGHQGTPQRVVLTPHSNVPSGNNNATPPTPNEEDNAVEEESQQPPVEPPPPPPQAAPTPSAPDVPVRTQQQLIQEMQERQRQLQQQQQQQQQNPQQ